MSDILIKGMTMPRGESCVTVRIWGDGRVIGVHNDSLVKHAIELPPHGRLGDLDEINEKHDKLSRDFCHGYFKSTWDFVCAARKLFYDAPTIIPAEEGE